MPTYPMQADTCSTRDAGKLLGVSLRTVQLWVDGGLLEAWKTVGGHRRITIASVKRLQEERTVARSTGEPKTAVRAGRKPVVLVVEDDADLLMLYETTLSLWEPPVTVLTANNGFDGLLRIGEAPPDLLITDLSMPGIDGFQMLRSLHANPAVGDMRIAVVTGLDKDDIALRGGIPDDVALFRKPVPFEHLKSLLDDLPALRRPRAA